MATTTDTRRDHISEPATLTLWRHLFGDQTGYIGVMSGKRVAGKRDLAQVEQQAYPWPAVGGFAEEWLAGASRRGREAYFCCHLLTKKRRVKAHAAPLWALYADGDGATVPPHLPQPTAIVQTSPGRYNYFWRTARPLAPAAAETLNKRLAAAIGADPSGFDLTQLLRPPGTRNYKYPGAPAVALVSIEDRAYDPDELDRLLPPLPEPASRPAPPPSTGACAIGDDERLAAAMRHATFGPLYHGDQLHYKSASEGDAAFALIGLFYAAGNPMLVDQWIRQSARMRPKWDTVHHSDGRTYGQGTLAHALSTWDGVGYDPAYRSAPPAPAPDDTPRLAALVRELAGERRRRERAEAELARCREEHARQDARIAELETAVKALDACIAHSNQTVGGAATDIAEEIVAAYQRGDTLVQNGKEYARVVNTQAAKRRSASTVGRATEIIFTARPDDIITRTETIETARFKGPVDISYIHVPPEHRQRPADITLHLLPPPTKKTHGGRRITVPPEVAAQDAPVRRETCRVERFFSLKTDAQLGVIEGTPFIDFCTADGTPITAAEAEAYRVEIGAQPAPPPRYRPVQSRLQDACRVPYVPSMQVASGLLAETATSVPPPVHDPGDPLASTANAAVETRLQDASGFEPLPIPRNQGCNVASCGRPPVRDAYCAEHHPDRWGDYAAAREYATREVFAL